MNYPIGKLNSTHKKIPNFHISRMMADLRSLRYEMGSRRFFSNYRDYLALYFEKHLLGKARGLYCILLGRAIDVYVTFLLIVGKKQQTKEYSYLNCRFHELSLWRNKLQ